MDSISSARSSLSTAEKTAAQSLNVSSLYQPSIRRKSSKKSTNNRKLKRGLATIFIIVIIGAFFAVSSAFSLLGFHIQELFTKVTNVQNTSRSLRIRTLGNHLLKNRSTKHTSLPKKFKSRLKQQGIEYGFLDQTGKFIAGDAPRGTAYVLKYKDDIITDFSTKTAKNPLFIDATNRASRSNIAGFFDHSAERHYRKQHLTRNDFADYRQTGDTATDEKSFKDIIGRRLGGNAEIRVGTADDKQSSDSQSGEKPKKPVVTDTNSTAISGADATAKAKAYLDNIGSKSQTGNYACTALKVGNLISAAISALESFHSIGFFMNITENISKVKAGVGHKSAIHPIMNFFNRSATNTITDTATGNSLEITGTPLESTGMRSILHGLPPNKATGKNFSLERSNHITKTSNALKNQSLRSCTTNQTVGAVISLASFAIPGGGLLKASVALLKTTVFSIGLQLAIGGALAVLIPTIAEAMFTNRVETAIGKAGGELFTKGSFAAGSRLARSGSGFSPAGATSALAFNSASLEVNKTNTIAKKTARPVSPFDLTSTDSLFGQISLKFATNFSGTKNPLTIASNINRSFISSLLPSSFATGENTSYSTTFGDCPTLESIGAKGDIYCNPITTSDLTTLELDPDDSTYQSIIKPNLDYSNDSSKPTIKPNSNLANYIIFCTERDSPFGTIDANISNAMQTSLGVVGDNLPILNDIIDIINAAEDNKNLPWATGAICVNSESNPSWNNEFKYYQRYIEDERIMTQLNDSPADNPVLAFKSAYELEHPLDHSLAGTIARLTGLTKYDAEGLLAITAHQQFISHYHPSILHQFGLVKSPLVFNIPSKAPSSHPSIISHISNFVNKSYAFTRFTGVTA